MVRLNGLFLLGLVWPALAAAQQAPEIARILDRLDKLEKENSELVQQVRELQSELATVRGSTGSAPTAEVGVESPPKPTVDERLDIQESRIEEQAQTKVEASQKFPITLTGMALFNAFTNSRQSNGQEYPTAAFATGAQTAGATLRQTIVGLEFRGPQTIWGGNVHGSLYMDFFAGGPTFNSMMRLRTGSIQIDWKTRSFMAGIEKPIFNPLEPSSLAQSGVSPLTGTGNLWLWLPQARFEQDVAFTPSSGLRARVGVVQTSEKQPYDSPAGTVPVTPGRPGLEGRFEFYHKFDEDRRITVASGFHVSQTHAGGLTIPSNVYQIDIRTNPWRRIELTGVAFTGRNLTNLGAGAINEGYVLYGKNAHAINARGGWTQLTLHTTRRLDFHLFSGLQYYENGDLGNEDVTRNMAYGMNLFYHIAPNVILGPEISQYRTLYIGPGVRLNNHYDFALGYLF
jgi:hypothetical protein